MYRAVVFHGIGCCVAHLGLEEYEASYITHAICILHNKFLTLMPSITKEFISNYIKQNAIQLNSTHKQLCIPIIDRIYRKMLAGIKFDPIKVNDKLICDGHHRYLASLFAGYPLHTIPYPKTSATEMVPWTDVYFEEEDWDTIVKINVLNKQDAEYNNLSLDKLLEMLKNI